MKVYRSRAIQIASSNKSSYYTFGISVKSLPKYSNTFVGHCALCIFAIRQNCIHGGCKSYLNVSLFFNEGSFHRVLYFVFIVPRFESL